MPLRVLAIVFVAMATGATPTYGEDPKEGNVVSDYQRVPEFKDEKVVCRSVEQTGTRIARKVCTTEEQRKAEKAGAQQFLDDFTRGAAIQKQTKG